MKLKPSTGIFAALLLLVVGLMIGATLTRTVDRWPLTEVDGEGWFFVEALGCKFPIPDAYTLKARDPDEIFLYYDYDRVEDVMETLQTYYPLSIRIKQIEGEYQHYYSDHFDLKYETLKQHNDLTYEHMTYDGKHGFYFIRNKEQIVRFMGGSREVVDLMFDYCVAHPIEESNLNCETRDGYVYCD